MYQIPGDDLLEERKDGTLVPYPDTQAPSEQVPIHGCIKHKRCRESGLVNCIREYNFSQKKDLPHQHYWRRVAGKMQDDGSLRQIEKCKGRGCQVWRAVVFKWTEKHGKIKVLPSVQYMMIPDPQATQKYAPPTEKEGKHRLSTG